jgi:hypothetical protein
MVTKCRDDEIGIKLLQIFRQMVNNDCMRDKVVHRENFVVFKMMEN